jgi:hypothetical protein
MNYIELTSRNYEVYPPDRDNEICVEWTNDADRIFLTKEDVLLLLSRFDKE